MNKTVPVDQVREKLADQLQVVEDELERAKMKAFTLPPLACVWR